MKNQNNNNQQIQIWYKICNMRTTLLQLQYLYCSITQDLEQQSINFTSIHQDRIIQYNQLSEEVHELTASNISLLLIVKLQSLLSLYTSIDTKIWQNLTQFIKCVKYIQQEIARDVCKLYIGNNVMIYLQRCQKQLKNIQQKIIGYMKDNTKSIEEYNRGIRQVENLEEIWEKYLVEVKEKIRDKIQPNYGSYLKRKLAKRQKILQNNIKILRQFIKQ